MTNMQKAMKRAVDFAGGLRPLARLIGTSPQLISYMLRNKASAGLVLAIEKETEVSRHDLRPDIYPREEAA